MLNFILLAYEQEIECFINDNIYILLYAIVINL